MLVVNMWIICLLVFIFSGLVLLGRLVELINIGIFFVFMIVLIGILYLCKLK